MPCWSRFFWVTADTDRATLFTVEVWRVAVTTTSSMALALLAGAGAGAAACAKAAPDRAAAPSAVPANKIPRSPPRMDAIVSLPGSYRRLTRRVFRVGTVLAGEHSVHRRRSPFSWKMHGYGKLITVQAKFGGNRTER